MLREKCDAEAAGHRVKLPGKHQFAQRRQCWEAEDGWCPAEELEAVARPQAMARTVYDRQILWQRQRDADLDENRRALAEPLEPVLRRSRSAPSTPRTVGSRHGSQRLDSEEQCGGYHADGGGSVESTADRIARAANELLSPAVNGTLRRSRSAPTTPRAMTATGMVPPMNDVDLSNANSTLLDQLQRSRSAPSTPRRAGRVRTATAAGAEVPTHADPLLSDDAVWADPGAVLINRLQSARMQQQHPKRGHCRTIGPSTVGVGRTAAISSQVQQRLANEYRVSGTAGRLRSQLHAPMTSDSSWLKHQRVPAALRASTDARRSGDGHVERPMSRARSEVDEYLLLVTGAGY
eukprot:gnl/TRDRNA2_/TRDRNA2_168601_c0_seq1.p1 gnl/TRDRNA2_/TRDRNA2_168601_c0~~gnl/TRDRNA2_/TRDRNA2_168601_c0_seq1.p1  ORF type:complete len:350 (-),score=57.90 gnl/TRDRNA2_/TRDRNA2_168601_c0_seq1:70-1119(-)